MGPNNDSQREFEVAIFDGGYLLHSFISKCGKILNYGCLARNMLSSISKQYHGISEIHICFDTYSDVSLKFQERERRGQIDSEFLITGPDQAPKQSNETLLQNSSFKNELSKFLLKE